MQDTPASVRLCVQSGSNKEEDDLKEGTLEDIDLKEGIGGVSL